VQPSEFGVVEGVVDGDEPSPGCGEERRRNGGPLAAGAVDPHLGVGNLVDPFRQLVQGDVEGVLDAGGRELGGTADVEDDNSAVVPDVVEVGEGGAGKIQASPRRAWREYAIMTGLLLWALYPLVTSTFGLFG
jgi:hypothetical protein